MKTVPNDNSYLNLFFQKFWADYTEFAEKKQLSELDLL